MKPDCLFVYVFTLLDPALISPSGNVGLDYCDTLDSNWVKVCLSIRLSQDFQKSFKLLEQDL